MNAATLDGNTFGLFGVTGAEIVWGPTVMFAPVTFEELMVIPETLPAGFASFCAPVPNVSSSATTV